jgi:Cof subfamily protein (haloacid dehalogenase superfamily)
MPETTLQEQPEIRLIVSDLDGTLLNSQHNISPRTQKALHDAIAAGVNVVFATGKTRYSAQNLIKDLSLTTPGVYVQGVVTYNGDGSIRKQHVLDTALVRRMLTFLQERGFDVLVYSGARIFARRKSEWSDLVEHYGEPPAEIINDLYQRLPEISVNKLCIGGTEQRIRALHWQLDRMYHNQIATTRAGVDGMMEVLPPGFSKGKGVVALIKDMGLDPKNVMAIGDGENDVDMLKSVGVPVAMSNAKQVLKDVAKYIVASNDEDGVAEAIERFVLKTTKAPEAPATETVVVDASTPEAATTAETGTETPPAVSEAVEKAAEKDLPIVVGLETLEVPSLANAAPPFEKQVENLIEAPTEEKKAGE